jgi:putative transposase
MMDLEVFALKTSDGPRIPEIWNSDQGSHFTSDTCLRVMIERSDLNEYSSSREVRKRINTWFHSYNTKRPHQSLDYRNPWEVLQEGTI